MVCRFPSSHRQVGRSFGHAAQHLMRVLVLLAIEIPQPKAVLSREIGRDAGLRGLAQDCTTDGEEQ